MFLNRFVITFVISFCVVKILHAQPSTLKVLFLGNSYTNVNNLPKLLSDIALSTGDTIITDENTPGGQTLMGHSTNATSLAKINSAKWNFVVLQDQSQLPSFPEPDVIEMVYPYARALDSMIDANSACTKTVFYMTWGRKNGDAQNCAFWPPVCTYQGMDSLLALRYRKMADDNKALLSPVGALWRHLRTNNAGIELYQTDESHPTLAGSYAAACCFYTIILKKDPTLITYNAGLAANEAATIREAAKLVVYQNLGIWNVGLFEPRADFSSEISDSNSRVVKLMNHSTDATNHHWEFGDGDTSNAMSPQHEYKQAGSYKIRLTASRCDLSSTMETDIVIVNTGIHSIVTEQLSIYPNPTNGLINYSFPENYLDKEYQLTDIYGKVLLNEKIQKVKGIISVENLPAGVYDFQLNGIHRKVIKE